MLRCHSRGRLCHIFNGLLGHVPRPAGCRKLSGTDDAYRIRVGDYRIVYQILDRVLIVYVVRVAHRKDVYRGL